MFKSISIFSGGANAPLAAQIAEYLEIPLGRSKVSRFSDGEIFTEIQENVRGVDVYVVQPTCAPVNDNLMELLIMVDALKRASAGSITAVHPYYGYGRQDRKVAPRTPITAKLVADLLTAAGVQRVVSRGSACRARSRASSTSRSTTSTRCRCSSTTCKQRYPTREAGRSCRRMQAAWSARARSPSASTSTSPSSTSVASGPNVSEVMNVIGDVEGRDCVILDDMIDTAGTLTNAAQALKDKGARSVSAAATHAVLSGPAVERIANSVLDEVRDGLLLEVVTEGEVAAHLEERAVPDGLADLFDVRGRTHFCTLVARGLRRRFAGGQVRDERHHARHGEEQRRVRRHQGRRRYHGMALFLEEVEPAADNLVGFHGACVLPSKVQTARAGRCVATML